MVQVKLLVSHGHVRRHVWVTIYAHYATLVITELVYSTQKIKVVTTKLVGVPAVARGSVESARQIHVLALPRVVGGTDANGAFVEITLHLHHTLLSRFKARIEAIVVYSVHLGPLFLLRRAHQGPPHFRAASREQGGQAHQVGQPNELPRPAGGLKQGPLRYRVLVNLSVK